MDQQLKVVSPKTLKTLNTQLGKLEYLYNELCKAESAGVGDLSGEKQQCADMKARIEQFKRVYFAQEI